MSAALVGYLLVVGTLLACAAAAVDGALRGLRWPSRWAWGAAMLATLALSGRALRDARSPAPAPGAWVLRPAATSHESIVHADSPASLIHALRAAELAFRMELARLSVGMPARATRALLAAWAVLTALALVTLLLVHLRLHRARCGWPAAELQGRRVRVAPQVGPALVGVVRPVIVVPRWLLACDADEQRLVLAHEAEHLRARDHLLLGAACIAVALVPWHPAVWWMHARLRLAVELDCDARLLRAGVAPRRYGGVLIDLADRCAGFRVGATALADKPSHLERRLLAMRPLSSRFTSARVATLACGGALSLLAACEARMPTSAEVQAMDVAGAEHAAGRSKVLDEHAMANTLFYIDGVRTTAAEAHALAANKIVSVAVSHGAGRAPAAIRIITAGTRALADDGASGTLHQWHVRMHDALMGARGADTGKASTVVTTRDAGGTVVTTRQPGSKARLFDGVILIDGVRVDPAAMQRLDPNLVQSVEVVKGAAARQQSSDPAAVNGLIRVTTKKP